MSLLQKLTYLDLENSMMAASMLQFSASTKKEQIMNPVRLNPCVQWTAIICKKIVSFRGEERDKILFDKEYLFWMLF